MRDGTHPTRRNRAPRLDDRVYGKSGYACHLNVHAHRGEWTFARRRDLARLVWDLVPRAAEHCGIRLYACCLMPNHLHIVATV